MEPPEPSQLENIAENNGPSSELSMTIVNTSKSPEEGAEPLESYSATAAESTEGETDAVDVAIEGPAGKRPLCEICLEDLPVDAPTLPCGHSFCSACLVDYYTNLITERRINLRCANCKDALQPDFLITILPSDIYEKHLNNLLDSWLTQNPSARRCPAADCSNAVIIEDGRSQARPGTLSIISSIFSGRESSAACKGVDAYWRCDRTGCTGQLCMKCGEPWHPGVRCEINADLMNIGLTQSVLGRSSNAKESVRVCPGCRSPVFKIEDGTCNHMVCAVCETHFCWLCMSKVTELHFLTPSGCTYFGDRKWTTQKRMGTQLALAATAPALIGLAAAVAVPAILISLPYKATRKVYKDAASRSKSARVLSAASAGFGALTGAPVAAALAVALGVPALVITAYVVIPHHLVRQYATNKKVRREERKRFLERQALSPVEASAGQEAD